MERKTLSFKTAPASLKADVPEVKTHPNPKGANKDSVPAPQKASQSKQTPPKTPQQKRRENYKKNLEVVIFLQKKFPKLFTVLYPKPLKVGICEDLVAASTPYSKIRLRHALGLYTNTRLYLQGMLDNTHRFDLEGAPCEEITDAEKEYVQGKYEKFREALPCPSPTELEEVKEAERTTP